ncbi:MAG: TonB family protein, partial [Cyclobacteriaceae bacterium]
MKYLLYRTFITACLLLITTLSGMAQDLPEEQPDEIFTIVEDKPTPAGGMEGWSKYLQENLHYPTQAKRMGIEGKVYIQFIVEKDGSISEVKAIKGIGAGCDEEAERVIRNAPDWNPGRQRGKNVRVRMVIPLFFKLSRDNPADKVLLLPGDMKKFGKLDTRPVFQGGMENFLPYIKEKAVPTQRAIDAGISGEVVIAFVVDKDGEVKKANIMRRMGYGLDDAALELV